jgi:hypothetical protein
MIELVPMLPLSLVQSGAMAIAVSMSNNSKGPVFRFRIKLEGERWEWANSE